jgi:hypothetical protein
MNADTNATHPRHGLTAKQRSFVVAVALQRRTLADAYRASYRTKAAHTP